MAEFLLQAIGEFDAGDIAVLAVASVTVWVVRQLLGTVATEWLRRLLNPRVRRMPVGRAPRSADTGND